MSTHLVWWTPVAKRGSQTLHPPQGASSISVGRPGQFFRWQICRLDEFNFKALRLSKTKKHLQTVAIVWTNNILSVFLCLTSCPRSSHGSELQHNLKLLQASWLSSWTYVFLHWIMSGSKFKCLQVFARPRMPFLMTNLSLTHLLRSTVEACTLFWSMATTRSAFKATTGEGKKRCKMVDLTMLWPAEFWVPTSGENHQKSPQELPHAFLKAPGQKLWMNGQKINGQ